MENTYTNQWRDGPLKLVDKFSPHWFIHWLRLELFIIDRLIDFEQNSIILLREWNVEEILTILLQSALEA